MRNVFKAIIFIAEVALGVMAIFAPFFLGAML